MLERELDQVIRQRDVLAEALRGYKAFVAVMFGVGPDAVIPETVVTPLGVPVKLGDICRAGRAALAAVEGKP